MPTDALWVITGIVYLVLGFLLSGSGYKFPKWVWTIYIFMAFGVLSIYNLEHIPGGTDTPLEIVFGIIRWVGSLFIGSSLFVILISIRKEVNEGVVTLPTAREGPVVIWEFVKEVFSKR